MRTVEVQVGGKKLPFSELEYTKNIDLAKIDFFQLTLPAYFSQISKGDLVKIYVDGALEFKGYYEEREAIDAGAGGDRHVISGRSVAVKLLNQVTGRELYNGFDPADIIKALNSPNERYNITNCYYTVYPMERDTYVYFCYYSGNPNSSKNYGTEIELTIEVWNQVNPSQRRVKRILLKPTLPSNISGASIRIGKLWLFKEQYDHWRDGSYGVIGIYRITADWGETTVTWNNQPTHDGTLIASRNWEEAISGWRDWNVKSCVQGWADGSYSNYGWKIKDSLEKDDAWVWVLHDFDSRESNPLLRPYLELVYRKNESPYADASASHNNDYAILACDNSLNTAWETGVNQASGQLWKLDLGSTISLKRLHIFQGSVKYARNWKIEISTNDVNWTQIASDSNSTDPNIAVILATAQNARYIKITLTGSASYGWAILDVAVFKSTGSEILSQGTIQNYGQTINARFDYQKRLDGMMYIADLLGWNVYATFDESSDYLNFAARGSDVSGTVKFLSGINLLRVRLTDDFIDLVNRVYTLGHGEGGEQLESMAEDSTSISTYGVHEDAFTVKETISQSALDQFASTLIAELKDVPVKLLVTVLDTYSLGSYNPGDQVWIRDDNLGIDGKFRVYEIKRRFAGESEETSLVVGSRLKDLSVFIRSWLAENLRIWADSSQDLNARTQVEP